MLKSIKLCVDTKEFFELRRAVRLSCQTPQFMAQGFLIDTLTYHKLNLIIRKAN